MSVSFEQYAKSLSNYAQFRHARGCSIEEIQKLEEHLKFVLPEDYRLFLKTCGHGVENFFTGSDYKYEELLDNQQAALELIQESGAPFMPNDSVVFLMHQGYTFQFLCSTGVYTYLEGDLEFEKKDHSFRDFFYDRVWKGQ